MAAKAGDTATIRLATEDDADTLHALLLELARATGPADKIASTSDDLRRFGFSEPIAFQALIAEAAGEAVGFCLFFYNFSSWRGELGVYVQDLYVAEEARGAGLGRKLIAETVKLAESRGATHLRLSVDRTNVNARDFYRRLGLKATDRELIFEASGPSFERLRSATTE